MPTRADDSPLPLELPLMHVQPHRSLAYVSVNFSDAAPQDRLVAAVRKAGAAVQSTYIQHADGPGGSRALLAVDITDAANGVQGVMHELSAIRGVEGVTATAPDQGLAATERHTLSVAGTPMVVMAREVLSGAFKRFLETAGHQVVCEAGVEMGSLAASAVPPLLERLERPLTLELLRRRLLDFQVFGWAIVKGVSLDDSLHGEIELDQSFESIAWQGKAPEPTCDFLRGFTTGVFSTAYSCQFRATEPQCQGKGDQVCSISFAPVT